MTLPIVLSTLGGCISQTRIPSQNRITRAEKAMIARFTSIEGLLSMALGQTQQYNSLPSEQPPINYSTRNSEAIARVYFEPQSSSEKQNQLAVASSRYTIPATASSNFPSQNSIHPTYSHLTGSSTALAITE